MTEYKSRFAAHMNNMVEYRVALGYSEKTYAPRLARFDRFIVEKHSDEKQLSKALVMDWITRRNEEGASTIQNRAAIARLFAEYLTSVGCDAYILPKNFVSRRKAFIPYIFTDCELTNLFGAVDRLSDTKKDMLRSCTASTMLRLIYTCGLRPGEGLRLKKENVNLDTGEILITEAKLKKDRKVVVSDDMLKLLRKYAMQSGLAGRGGSQYFFVRQDGYTYDTEWLEAIMKSCFRRANANIEEENLPRVRVYDLRHRFASAVLCKWLDEGKTLNNMLPYLRTYMGHSSLSETAYYIHILPENLLKSKGIEWDKLDAVIPEDDIWGE